MCCQCVDTFMIPHVCLNRREKEMSGQFTDLTSSRHLVTSSPRRLVTSSRHLVTSSPRRLRTHQFVHQATNNTFLWLQNNTIAGIPAGQWACRAKLHFCIWLSIKLSPVKENSTNDNCHSLCPEQKNAFLHERGITLINAFVTQL